MKVTLDRSIRTGECRVWLHGWPARGFVGVGKTRMDALLDAGEALREALWQMDVLAAGIRSDYRPSSSRADDASC